MIVGATAGSSSNCTLVGSAPSAAAWAWYQPASAHGVVRVQPLSDRWPRHCISATPGTFFRAITSTSGMAAGQSWLDQIRSEPETSFTATVRGDTR